MNMTWGDVKSLSKLKTYDVYFVFSILQELLLCREKNHDESLLSPTLFSLFHSSHPL